MRRPGSSIPPGIVSIPLQVTHIGGAAAVSDDHVQLAVNVGHGCTTRYCAVCRHDEIQLAVA